MYSQFLKENYHKVKHLPKEERRKEISRLYKENKPTENKKYQVKKIVVPKGQGAVINIYMTQNNTPSHIVEEKDGKTHHHISMPLPTAQIPAPQLPTLPTPSKKWEPVQTVHKVIDNSPSSINVIKGKKKKEEIILPTEILSDTQRVEEEKRLNELLLLLEEDNMSPLVKGITENSIKKLRQKLLKGQGLKDWFKNAYSVITNPTKALYTVPKQVSDNLKKYGKYNIRGVYICRVPLQGLTRHLLNFITLGKFSQEAKKFDEVYHLYAVLHLDNGELLLTERNQRVILLPITRKAVEIEDFIYLPIDKSLSVNDLFSSAMRDDALLYHYDPTKHNCQNYVSTLLRSSGLLNENLSNFINQDVKNLVTGVAYKLSTKTIDIASLLENIVKGGNFWE